MFKLYIYFTTAFVLFQLFFFGIMNSMLKEKSVVLNTEYYKIVSVMVYRTETRKLLTTEWEVFSKYKQELTGIFSFSGEPVNGRVVLKYKAEQELKDKFFIELVRIICDWAFSMDDVYSIEFDVNDETLKDQLKTISFEEENGVFILRKEPEFYLFSLTILGIILGMSFGGCFQSEGLVCGLIIGGIAGLLTGTSMDKREKTHRQLVEKENYRE